MGTFLPSDSSETYPYLEKENTMRNKFSFMIVVILMAVVLTACGTNAYAQDSAATGSEGSTPRTMNVTGTGKVTLTPDIAYISIGVHTEGPNASQAVAENNSQTQKVVDALKSAGVAEKDIKTTNFSIYPQQKFDDKGQPTGEVIYMVDNTVYVTLRDISKVGEILDSAVKAGANNIYGIQFDVADTTEAVSEARKLAVENAEKAAKELATASGVTLGPIQTINSYGGGIPVPYSMGKGGGAVALDASVPVSAGQLELSVDVNIVYEIR
jgi:uncharacterized protein YggE